MNVFLFILIMSICLSIIYLVHKYYGKLEFYFLSIIYSILSFTMSFKIIKLFGININANVIFSGGLLLMLYYFVNRYNEKESKKLIYTIFSCNIFYIILLMINAFMIPSIFDKNNLLYQNIILNNTYVIILYPIVNLIINILSKYVFKELKNIKKYKILKNILSLTGIILIESLLFVYFSYAFSFGFIPAIDISLNTYVVKIIVMVIYILICEKLFDVKKAK